MLDQYYTVISTRFFVYASSTVLHHTKIKDKIHNESGDRNCRDEKSDHSSNQQLDVVVRRRNQQREVLEQHHQEMPLLPKRMKTWERIEKIPYSYDPRSS
uniref:Uncharacterized protein n=1 Tax=Pristionchus pacificus TaxID=54126 RepID=A0A2A6CA69_PRIPA|eukprot:PDM75115.1 hypothetical protein PRIPAC_40496 [Pristionchus pacificus]